MRVTAILIALLSLGVAKDDPVVSLQVSPNIQYEPGKIKLKISVASHQDNTQFCIGYRVMGEPEELTIRRSCQQLNGIYSPRVFWFEYKGIPAEQYIAFATVIRAPKRLAGTAQAQFQVLSSQ